MSRWAWSGAKSLGVAGLAAVGLLTAWAGTPSVAQPAAQGAASASAAPSQGVQAELPGKAVFETICSNCHELSIATDQRKSREDWNTTVQNMLNHGAPMSNEQAAQVVEYLAKAYGPDSK